jgi:hypothetical protein
MKKYILSLAVIIFISLFWFSPFATADSASGVVKDHGLVEQPQGKVKQPIDEFNAVKAKQKASQDEAEDLGRETARRFYNGQITSDEVQRRYQHMVNQGLQRDYMRGYNAWKTQHISAPDEENKSEEATSENSGEE